MPGSSIARSRAERGLPGGSNRQPSFAGNLRAQLVQRGGKSMYRVEGHATTFNKPYVMYDMFGEYTETVAGSALDKSLANGPDVAFLTNHRGVTMARTTNGSLELSKDASGLLTVAYLNPDRQDVIDLVSAIDDGLIDEMSFAFKVADDGYRWNKDYTALTLTQIDIHRGDVSAVNYGANPSTDIAMRVPEIIREIRYLPSGAISAVQAELDKLNPKPKAAGVGVELLAARMRAV